MSKKIIKFNQSVTTNMISSSDGSSTASIIAGDSRNILSSIPDGFFQTCITSPPYWSLRDYGVEGQIGLESTLDEYIKDLVSIFEEVRRVLRNDGTFWLNIGDSYTSGNRTWRAPDKKNPARSVSKRPQTPEGLKPKDLIGIPWRIAFALQSAGWYLRSDIIWYKPNCQPESVRDRPTRSHEYLFFFSKSENYLYDVEAVKGPNDRRLRSVWSIHSKPYKEAHFATFPPELIDDPILLSSKKGDWILDPFNGSGTTGEVALLRERNYFGVEINQEYINITKKRLESIGGQIEHQ